MTVVGDRMSDRDISLLAKLHVETLPESLVSTIGLAYARAFYRYVAAAADEAIFLERDDSAGRDIVGACVVSRRPDTLNRRLLLGTPLMLLLPLALGRVLGKIWLAKKEQAGVVSARQPRGPEVLLIFTMPRLRSNGCGARMLERVESWLGGQGIPRVFVKTRDAIDNRALAFYERCGYTRLNSLTVGGKKLALFEKQLEN